VEKRSRRPALFGRARTLPPRPLTHFPPVPPLGRRPLLQIARVLRARQHHQVPANPRRGPSPTRFCLLLLVFSAPDLFIFAAGRANITSRLLLTTVTPRPPFRRRRLLTWSSRRRRATGHNGRRRAAAAVAEAVGAAAAATEGAVAGDGVDGVDAGDSRKYSSSRLGSLLLSAPGRKWVH
jgi:hypothetical protein